MHKIIDLLFGQGKELTVIQLSIRAFVIYFITLALLRISGLRTFGKKSAFDNIVAIMLGAILSRAVVGVSPFWPTIAGCLVIVLLHRCLGWLCIYIKGLGKILKGEESVLYQNGRINHENMRKHLLTDGDLMESVRSITNQNSLAEIDEIFIERSGNLSIIRKNKANTD